MHFKIWMGRCIRLMQYLYSTLLIFTNTFSDQHSILFFSHLFFFNWKLLANCRKKIDCAKLRTSLSFHIEGALIGFNCLEGWGWRRKWYWGLDVCTFARKFKCKTYLILLGDVFLSPYIKLIFLMQKYFMKMKYQIQILQELKSKVITRVQIEGR